MYTPASHKSRVTNQFALAFGVTYRGVHTKVGDGVHMSSNTSLPASAVQVALPPDPQNQAANLAPEEGACLGPLPQPAGSAGYAADRSQRRLESSILFPKESQPAANCGQRDDPVNPCRGGQHHDHDHVLSTQ